VKDRWGNTYWSLLLFDDKQHSPHMLVAERMARQKLKRRIGVDSGWGRFEIHGEEIERREGGGIVAKERRIEIEREENSSD
jgi:hypothetical protein